MKRKAAHDLATETPSSGSPAAQGAKKHRGNQAAPKTGGKTQATPHVKRPRGRPPSEKTLRRRQEEAERAAAEAAAASAEPPQ